MSKKTILIGLIGALGVAGASGAAMADENCDTSAPQVEYQQPIQYQVPAPAPVAGGTWAWNNNRWEFVATQTVSWDGGGYAGNYRGRRDERRIQEQRRIEEARRVEAIRRAEELRRIEEARRFQEHRRDGRDGGSYRSPDGRDVVVHAGNTNQRGGNQRGRGGRRF